MMHALIPLESRTFSLRDLVAGWPLLVLCSLFVSGPAWGQSGAAESGPALEQADTQHETESERPLAVGVVASEDSADTIWRAAGLALAEGDSSAARDLWREFALRYPADGRAESAARMAEVITLVERSPSRETDITSQSGRVQLAIFGALYGASVGLLVGLEATKNRDSADAPVWLSVGGAGAGIGLTLGLTSGHYVRPAQPALISSGAVWGYALGLSIVGSGPHYSQCGGIDSDLYADRYSETCSISPSAFRMVPLAIAAAGVGATSFLAARYPDMPAGDVALLNAGGLWGSSTGLLAALVFDVDSEYSPVNSLLPGMVLGLAAGGLLAPQLDVSRTRMQLINMSGMLGIGLAAAVSVSADVDDPTGLGLLLLAGQTAGLATGALLTRNGGVRSASATALSSLKLAPTLLGDANGRQHRGLVLSGRW